MNEYWGGVILKNKIKKFEIKQELVNPTGGMNCFFPIPFRKGARITIENQHSQDIKGFFFQINYTLTESIPEETAYFHACWKRENPTIKKKDYTILSGVKGRGQYVGTYLAWTVLERYWWGEGEIKFYIDGDEKWPTLCGTGTEDYVGGAWCFYEEKEGKRMETTYSTPYLGYPFKSNSVKSEIHGENTVPMRGLYRWHLLDPVRFEEDLRVTIQQIGHNGRELLERSDDIASVAYWYQNEPHQKFPDPGPRSERKPG